MKIKRKLCEQVLAAFCTKFLQIILLKGNRFAPSHRFPTLATESRSPLFKNNVSNTSSAARCTFTWALTHSQLIIAVKGEKTGSRPSFYSDGKAWEQLTGFLRDNLEVFLDKYLGHCNGFGPNWSQWREEYRSVKEMAERRHLEVGSRYISSDSSNIRRDVQDSLVTTACIFDHFTICSSKSCL
jgi:hypothetical protein